MNKPSFRLFQIQAHTRLPRMAALQAARDALSAAGAALTDLQHYANQSSVFQLLLPPAAWPEMLRGLTEAALILDACQPPSVDALYTDKDGDVFGTLQLLYCGDEPDRRDQIPAVPG